MSYALQQTHSTLQKCLHKNSASAINLNTGGNLFAPAWEEIENFQPSFLQSAASASSAEALKVLVDVTITGCTNAMNMAFRLRQQMAEDSESGLSRLESSLGDILLWLRTSFAGYANEETAIPVSVAKQLSADIQHTLSEISGRINASVSGKWLNIISNLLVKIVEEEGGSPTYRQVACIKGLLAGIEEKLVSASPEVTTFDDWAELCIHYNCNDASVVHYITQHLYSEANNILSLTDRIEKWHGFKKEISNVVERGTVLYLGNCSLKASLLSTISNELLWLQQKEETLSSVYGSKNLASGSLQSNPLLTTLSVSQLAIWCRLLSGCDILKHDNQTELLKRVAGALQTTRAANISADSLRAKYYSPDRASLTVVKEHLFRMINLIKEM